MDGEKPLGGQSSEGGTNRPVISTNFTSEAFRVELRDGERPNNFQTQDSSLMIQPGNQTLQKKKTPSFQITSVVPNDGGEESPDETEDMSDILDSSKIESDFEKETPSYSEEYSKSEDVGVASELPSSTQYGITAVVQQNQSGGLLTSRLPPGITVNVTKGGIALAEADGVVPNDADNLSNRFKIVKIASNKPFKKGRWVCFDFMDSPASAPVGVRGPETAGQSSVAIPLASQLPVNQGQHMTSQHVPQQMMHIQHSQQLIHQPASVMSQQQYGSSQTATMAPGPPAYTSQGFQPITSSAMTSVNQKNLPVSMQQQQQQMHQIQQQMHHQMQQQLTQSTSVMPSQILDSQQMGSMSQAPMNNNVSESSSIGQAVSVMQQQLKNHDGGQTQSVSQQAHIQGVSTSVPLSQTMMSQQSLQYQPMPQQHVQQLPQTLPSQHSIPSQQQAQVSISQMQQTSQLQQQQPGKQEQMNAIQDQSPNSHSTPNYQPSQQQSQMGVQPLNLSAQAQTQLSSTQSSSQLTTAQHQVPPQSGAAQVSQGSLAHTSGMSSFVPPPTQTTTAASVSSQMNVSAVATPAQIVSGQGIPSIVPETTEGASEQVAASDENTPGDEDKASASTASTVAIDNKIEQAMDLVKSHLMFAVREEVDVLKERIGELMERINHLEYENTVLRKYASPEVLQQLQHPSANP